MIGHVKMINRLVIASFPDHVEIDNFVFGDKIQQKKIYVHWLLRLTEYYYYSMKAELN